jgi:predicted secreted protein
MLRIALVFILLSFNFPAHAESNPYNRVDFQVETTRDVSNDLLVANMSVEFQDKQPNLVAQQVNSAINNALKIAAAFSDVKVSSGNQSTRPVYGKNNQVDAWRGHAEIRLESRDFKAAGELIMRLQQQMQIASIQFTVAPDTHAQIENELIIEAIKKFQVRASAIRTAMGASSYKIVNLSINNGGGMPVPYPKLLMRGAIAMDTSIPAPEFAAGDSRMEVKVSGMIELQ